MSADTNGTEKKVHRVHLQVDAGHILQQLCDEDEDIPFGIRIGCKAIYDYLWKVSERCAKLNDPVLNKYMLLLHMYEVDDDKWTETLDEVERQAEELLRKEKEDEGKC